MKNSLKKNRDNIFAKIFFWPFVFLESSETYENLFHLNLKKNFPTLLMNFFCIRF